MSSVAVPAGDVRRDVRVISLVGMAHGLSHFYQLAMPPLFFLMKDDLGVGATQLGLVMTVFYATSGISQSIAGLGTRVFHPADFSILNGNVSSSRLGRAFGIHGFSGNLGWAFAYLCSLGLAGIAGWRVTLVVLGGVGLLATAYLASQSQYL